MVQSGISGKAKLISEMYGINVPAGGFDADSWQEVMDVFFPVLEDSVLLVDFLLETAPADCDSEMIVLLEGYTASWPKAEPEASFA